MFWVAAAILPAIAALQRYAVVYGYEGKGRAESLNSARSAFLAAAALDVLIVIAKLAQ